MYSTNPVADAAAHWEPIHQRQDHLDHVAATAHADFMSACASDQLDTHPAWCSDPVQHYSRSQGWQTRRPSAIECIACHLDEDAYVSAMRIDLARVLVAAMQAGIPGAHELLEQSAQRFSDERVNQADLNT